MWKCWLQLHQIPVLIEHFDIFFANYWYILYFLISDATYKHIDCSSLGLWFFFDMKPIFGKVVISIPYLLRYT